MGYDDGRELQEELRAEIARLRERVRELEGVLRGLIEHTTADVGNARDHGTHSVCALTWCNSDTECPWRVALATVGGVGERVRGEGRRRDPYTDFASVADEIRDLADRAGANAQEVDDLIERAGLVEGRPQHSSTTSLDGVLHDAERCQICLARVATRQLRLHHSECRCVDCRAACWDNCERATVERLRAALREALDVIAADRLLLGAHQGVREIARVERRGEDALTSTDTACTCGSGAHPRRCVRHRLDTEPHFECGTCGTRSAVE